ncbi:methyltransferase domain-containing protein [Maioricimonas sp. JC845]|uniref:class I SAM-dependent methyltransferase n=1 Tax=Maioricimonas sp. JC845 TaxID=3232138 RepID=UPI003458537B
MTASNSWNRTVYTFWSPVYDLMIRFPPFVRGRRRALGMLTPSAGESVLLAGIGTGADLPLLDRSVQWVGVDLTPAMLRRARRNARGHVKSGLVQADATRLPFADASFGAAVATLILSVVPDGHQCLKELCRVVRPGGHIVVFDKFAPDDGPVPGLRRLVNPLTRFFGTDVTRRLGDLSEGLPLEQTHPSTPIAGGAWIACRFEVVEGKQ